MSGSSAAAMTNRARECGLDVFYCNPTLGDGNCWYRAIVEQIHRKSVYNRISEGLRFTECKSTPSSSFKLYKNE